METCETSGLFPVFLCPSFLTGSAITSSSEFWTQSREGLRLFYQYAAEIGALPPTPQLRFADAAKACMAQ
jgi:hypothetical protein